MSKSQHDETTPRLKIYCIRIGFLEKIFRLDNARHRASRINSQMYRDETSSSTDGPGCIRLPPSIRFQSSAHRKLSLPIGEAKCRLSLNKELSAYNRFRVGTTEYYSMITQPCLQVSGGTGTDMALIEAGHEMLEDRPVERWMVLECF